MFVTIFGTLTSFPVFLSNLFKPGNYSTSDLSLIGVLSIAGGLFGSLFTGIFLDKTQAYLCVSRLQTFSCAILQGLAIWVIPSGNITLACAWCACIGFWFSMTFPCYINYSIILTHPIPSDATNGIMIALSFVYSSFNGLVLAKVIEDHWYVG